MTSSCIRGLNSPTLAIKDLRIRFWCGDDTILLVTGEGGAVSVIATLFISYDEDHNLPNLAGDLMQTQHCAGVAFIDMIVNYFFSYICKQA